MIEALIRTLQYDRSENLNLARSIPESVCDQLPAGLKQSPCWIVCHLCLADTRQAGSLTTGKPVGDDDGFFEEFGPSSDLTKARQHMNTRFGSWSYAIDAAEQSHKRLTDAITAADPQALSQPHPNEKVREWFPTLNDNLTYAAWHEGNHGGQLRAWVHVARQAGILT